MPQTAPSLQEALNQAMQLHRQGRLREAEARYQHILQRQPSNTDALYQPGLIPNHQSGNHDTACTLIKQALAINPKAASFHNTPEKSAAP